MYFAGEIEVATGEDPPEVLKKCTPDHMSKLRRRFSFNNVEESKQANEDAANTAKHSKPTKKGLQKLGRNAYN